MSENITLPYTLAFSNTPGLLRPLELKGGYRTHKMCNYIVTPGHCGLTVSFLSYADYMHISIVSDIAICKDPKKLLEKVEETLTKLISTHKFTADELEYSTSAQTPPLNKKNK